MLTISSELAPTIAIPTGNHFEDMNLSSWESLGHKGIHHSRDCIRDIFPYSLLSTRNFILEDVAAKLAVFPWYPEFWPWLT